LAASQQLARPSSRAAKCEPPAERRNWMRGQERCRSVGWADEIWSMNWTGGGGGGGHSLGGSICMRTRPHLGEARARTCNEREK